MDDVPIPKRSLVALAIVGIGALGTLALRSATRWGIGLGPDSVTYIESARHLMDGLGLTVNTEQGGLKPLTHYPPLFSALLAVTSVALRTDVLDAARWLGCVLLGCGVVLSAAVIRQQTKSAITAVIGATLLLLSFPMLRIYSVASSEPAFLLFGLLSTWLLALHLEHPNPGRLASAALCAALALLTRYAGLAVVVSGGLALLLLSPRSVRSRCRDAGGFLLISCLPSGIWAIRNIVATGTATNRTAMFHPVEMANVHLAARTVSEWLWPTEGLLGGIPIFLIAGVAAMSVLRRGIALDSVRRRNNRWPAVVGLFVIVYVVFLAASLSFFDASTPLDARVLCPIYAWGLIAFLCIGVHVARAHSELRVVPAVLALAAASYGALQVPQSFAWLAKLHGEGMGYASAQWKASETLEQLRALPTDTLIFSNGPDVIRILTGRRAVMIPVLVHPATRQPNEGYRVTLQEMQATLHRHQAVVAYLRAISWRWYLPSEDTLAADLSLHSVVTTADGAIYGLRRDDEVPPAATSLRGASPLRPRQPGVDTPS